MCFYLNVGSTLGMRNSVHYKSYQFFIVTLTFSSLGADYEYMMKKMYFIFPQVFQWNKDIFVPHHQLPLHKALNVALFPRGGVMYLLVSLPNASQDMLLYQWLNNEFRNLHQLPAKEIKHMEAWISGSDIYLITAKGI